MLNPLDPSALIVGQRREPWPDPADHPAPQRLVAHLSARKLISAGIFSVLLAVMVGLMLRDNAVSPEPYEGWRLWLRIAVAVAMGALGVGVGVAGVRALLSPKVLLEATQHGLHVPDLYREVIPWSEIVVVMHEKPRLKILGAGRLILGVRYGERFGRMATTDVKPAVGGHAIDAAQLPQLLDLPIERVMSSIQGYRAHFGRAGAASPE